MSSTYASVTIDSLETDEDAAVFREINEEWISRLFTLTDADRTILGDPRGQILARGGDVLVARVANGAAIGVIALISYGDGIFELSKMGVTPTAHGSGVGRKLIAGALARAAELGGRRVFLGTNSRLEPAIHLYETAGFRRITRAELPVDDYYARADILMEISLP